MSVFELATSLLRGRTGVPAPDDPHAVGPATPRGHRNSNSDWDFPFASPGRFKERKLKPNSERRMPFGDMLAYDPVEIPPRFVRPRVPWNQLRSMLLEFADDVGLVSIDDPAIAHEVEEIRYVYPHARSLIVLIGEENKPSLQSRYLPTANHELYQCEERLFAWGSRAIGLLRKAGGEGLTTTIGWPQEVSQRWSDKIWPLSHKLVAQAAGLGVIGTSRNFLHRKFGAYCLIDTIVTNLEFEAADYAAAAPIDWNPCLACNLCVATCPAEIHEAFHAGKEERIRYKEEHVRPLTHTRRHVEEQLVIDSPSVRDELGIAPGDWRTPPDPSRPGQQGTRLVQLQRIRVSNVDSMMRMMPMYFRYKEAEGLDITFQFDLSGEGGGRWTLRVADRRCEVRPGVAEDADLRICCDGTVLLGIHRGERNAVIDLLLGRIRLQGRKELFLLMPRLFPVNAPEGRLARWSWMLRRALRRYRSAA